MTRINETGADEDNDEALADGDIDADEAADLKAELRRGDLPGYKPSPFRGGGGGFGRGHGR